MNNSAKNNIPPLTEEQILRLYELSKMRDDEIDLSDIPEITEEEWHKKFKPARLRKRGINKTLLSIKKRKEGKSMCSKGYIPV